MACKTIAILTSGGDAPGMNAAIRAIVRSAAAKGIRPLGVRRGFNGLINKDLCELNIRSVSDIIERGGTMLYTARSPEFFKIEGKKKALNTCQKVGIDGVIAIGGNGTFKGVYEFSKLGISCISIPGTIDNDIMCSEYSIGFDTATNNAMEMIDKLRDTAQSHDRCTIVEVMGRTCGNIALHTGIAVGATAILVPEYKFDFKKDVIDRINFTQRIGKRHFIIIIAEGLNKTDYVKKRIIEEIGIESRITILGHVQRGGSPTSLDRITASQMGCYAIELLAKNISNRMIAMKHDKIISIEMDKAININKPFNFKLYKRAIEISI